MVPFSVPWLFLKTLRVTVTVVSKSPFERVAELIGLTVNTLVRMFFPFYISTYTGCKTFKLGVNVFTQFYYDIFLSVVTFIQSHSTFVRPSFMYSGDTCW